MKIQQLYDIYLKHPHITTDSRQIEAGVIFFALKGERFNGNKYAENALAKGAAYAVIDEVEFKKGARYILVDDVLTILQKLANFHRKQLNIPFIGITGSNGKTTTKELLNAVLATQFKTAFTKGNLNNHIGVPLTLLSIPLDTEIAIVEMGANHQGEIAMLCELAEPTHGIINNIGKAHLEGFGGIEGVKKGKAEMYAFLEKSNGIAFINEDLPFLKELAVARNVKNIVVYGKNRTNENQITLLETAPIVQFKITNNSKETVIKSHLMGIYNYHNMLTAAVIGQFFKVSIENIKAAIENYIPTNNRSQVVKKGSNTFMLDAYNANPTSTQHALEHFAKDNALGKIVILGDMLELGSASELEHFNIAKLAQNLFFRKIILVGKEYRRASMMIPCLHFDDVFSLKAWFEDHKLTNTSFLIKGSRGIRLEKLL